MGWGRAFLFAAILVHLQAGFAEAQSRRHPPEDPAVVQARAEARDHFNRGIQLMEQESYEAAAAEFGRSVDLYPTRSAVFNLANAHRALFDYVEAMGLFRRWLDDYGAEAPRDERRLVEQAIAELSEYLAEVRVDAQPVGAEILVDGVVVGTGPILEPIRIRVGRHRVGARMAGHVTQEREVTLASGDRTTVTIELAEVPHEGELRIEANVPGARVSIDGAAAGTVPFTVTLAEGSHEVRVSADGYVTSVQAVEIATGERRTLTVTLGDPPGTDPAWFWTMLGVTAATGIGAGVTGGLWSDRAEAYNRRINPTDAQYREVKDLEYATYGLIAVAAAAAVATTVLGFTTGWDSGDDEAPAPEVAPLVGFGTDGPALMLVGRF